MQQHPGFFLTAQIPNSIMKEKGDTEIMRILDYFESNHQAEMIEKISCCDWRAARFLVELLRNGTFFDTLGGWGHLYLLMDGENLVSFLTWTGQDAVRDAALYPWIGFVYTAPEYRGHRYAGKLLDRAEDAAARQGYGRVYIASNEVGLYEKYGYHYQENQIDCWGSDQQIFYKVLNRKK